MISYLLGFIWGFALLGSFAGWGSFLNRFLVPGRPAAFGLRVAWGIGLAVAAGGILNLAHAVSSPVLIGMVGAGLAFWALGPGDAAEAGDPGAEELLTEAFRSHPRAVALLALMLAFLYVGNVSSRHFHPQDDYHAYLVYPVRLIQEGNLGDDPFNNRRLESSLGGQAFLQAFAACVLDPRFGRLVDPGLGLLAALASLLAVAAQLGCRPMAVPLLLMLLVFLPPNFQANTSSLVLPVALIVAVFGTNLWFKRDGQCPRPVARATLNALLISALFASKSTLVPLSIALLGACYAAALVGEGRGRGAIRVLAEALLAGLLTLALVAPWMVSLYQTYGTPLYPLLGPGYHGSIYGTYRRPFDGATAASIAKDMIWFGSDPHILVCLLTALVGLDACRRADLRSRPVVLEAFVLVALGVAMLPMAIMTGHLYAIRYTYSIQLAVFGLSIALVTADRRREHGRGIVPDLDRAGWALAPLALCLLLGCFIGADWSVSRFVYFDKVLNIAAGIRGRGLVPPDEVEAYHQAQVALPVGARVIARLKNPFLLDFRRNTIFIPDWPGGASPPPGMPAFRGPEALADYLIDQDVRYVMYSYGDEANFSKAVLGFMTEEGAGIWNHSTAQHTFDFQDNLDILRHRRHRLYDDGLLVVFDLMRDEAPGDIEAPDGRPSGDDPSPPEPPADRGD